MYIYAFNDVDQDRAAMIAEEMATLGAPTIRAYNTGDRYLALDGSHRLAAAASLGSPVNLVIYDQDDEDMTLEHDIDGLSSPCTLREILEFGDWRNAVYEHEGGEPLVLR